MATTETIPIIPNTNNNNNNNTTKLNADNIKNNNNNNDTQLKTTSSSLLPSTKVGKHIIIIHLDLGIGGAEQLILQLAHASIDTTKTKTTSTDTSTDTTSKTNTNTNNTIEIITTRCEPNHCFDSVKPITGILYPYLLIWGKWIPHSLSLPVLLFHRQQSQQHSRQPRKYGTAFFSTIRLLYLCSCVILRHYILTFLITAKQEKEHKAQTQQQQQQQLNHYSYIIVPVIKTILYNLLYSIVYIYLYIFCSNATTNNITTLLSTYISPDIIVMDVLSTPLPIIRYLLPQVSVLFYCHFPDKLLVQNINNHNNNNTNTTTTTTTTNNNNNIDKTNNNTISKIDDNNNNNNNKQLITHNKKGLYRQLLDTLEEYTMIYTDMTVVNSQFTKNTVYTTFPSLVTKYNDKQLPVLYPALEIQQQQQQSEQSKEEFINYIYNKKITRQRKLVLSINRYERKKNLSLFINAIGYIYENNLLAATADDTDTDISDIDFIIAGGYDTSNNENVDYYNELQQLVQQLKAKNSLISTSSTSSTNNINIQFLQSISDIERTNLLQEACIVIYTPDNEHFGIVPLESMYYGTPVIACSSGGPLETIIHNETGILCTPNCYQSFSRAIIQLLQLVSISTNTSTSTSTSTTTDRMTTTTTTDKYKLMVSNCHYHVINKFGPQRFVQEWNNLLEQTLQIGTERYNNYATNNKRNNKSNTTTNNNTKKQQ